MCYEDVGSPLCLWDLVSSCWVHRIYRFFLGELVREASGPNHLAWHLNPLSVAHENASRFNQFVQLPRTLNIIRPMALAGLPRVKPRSISQTTKQHKDTRRAMKCQIWHQRALALRADPETPSLEPQDPRRCRSPRFWPAGFGQQRPFKPFSCKSEWALFSLPV